MSDSQTIDLNNEFNLLLKLINDLWQGCDSDAAHKALRASFDKGLEDAKLWIDEYAVIRIGEALGDKEISFPLDARRQMAFKGNTTAYLYDALYKFDSNLSYGLSVINRSVTGYGRWD